MMFGNCTSGRALGGLTSRDRGGTVMGRNSLLLGDQGLWSSEFFRVNDLIASYRWIPNMENAQQMSFCPEEGMWDLPPAF